MGREHVIKRDSTVIKNRVDIFDMSLQGFAVERLAARDIGCGARKKCYHYRGHYWQLR
jgi:hypothetical protein